MYSRMTRKQEDILRRSCCRFLGFDAILRWICAMMRVVDKIEPKAVRTVRKLDDNAGACSDTDHGITATLNGVAKPKIFVSSATVTKK